MKITLLFLGVVFALAGAYYLFSIDADNAGDSLEVFSSDPIGYQFVYPSGTNGYVLVPNVESEHGDFVEGVTLMERSEYEALQESTDAREGPPSIQVRVYENSARQSAAVWTIENPRETNIGLAISDTEEAVVGGANAEHFVADGLYPIDTYVFANGGHMYILSVMYPDEEATIYRDFQSLVASFTFTLASE